MNRIFFIPLIIFFVNVSYSIEPTPTPTILLSGEKSDQNLTQQVNINRERKKNIIPTFLPSKMVDKTHSFGPEIDQLNNDIEAFIQKMTPEASKLTNSQLTNIYLKYKEAQQTNILLRQQKNVLFELRIMNKNMETIVKQNNTLISILTRKIK